MSKCFWSRNGVECDAPAIMMLKANDGCLRQACEFHYALFVGRLRRIASGEIEIDDERDWVAAANHWFILNKIPI